MSMMRGGNAIVYGTDENGSLVDITNSTEEHIGLINPIRYRGYFYDADMGLYYLMSRYYDASIGRFINADGQITKDCEGRENNLFTYCGNSPVIRADYKGKSWVILGIFIVGVTLLCTACSKNTSTKKPPAQTTPTKPSTPDTPAKKTKRTN